VIKKINLPEHFMHCAAQHWRGRFHNKRGMGKPSEERVIVTYWKYLHKEAGNNLDKIGEK